MSIDRKPPHTSEPTIGFSLGAIFKISQAKISSESIDFFEKFHATHSPKTHTAIEISAYRIKELDYVEQLSTDLHDRFDYVSLHAPYSPSDFNNAKYTPELLDRIDLLQDKHSFDAVVVHPDVVDDWSLFDGRGETPYAVENMDDKKQNGQSIKELLSLPENLNIVLDLQHCFTLDPSMQLCRDMISEFKERIVEIHVSGAEENGYHVTLSETGQDEMVIPKAVELGVPFIIESVLKRYGDAKVEWEHVQEVIGNSLN